MHIINKNKIEFRLVQKQTLKSEYRAFSAMHQLIHELFHFKAYSVALTLFY